MKNQKIKAKIQKIKTDYKTFGFKNYLILNNFPICSICNKPIDTNNNIYLCSDFDMIFHENCYNPTEHFKEKYKDKPTNIKQKHIDLACILIVVNEIDYNNSSFQEIELDISVMDS